MNIKLLNLFQNLEKWNTEIAKAFNGLKTRIGLLSGLKTSNKSSIVEAINELHDVAQAAATSGGAAINDSSPSPSTVYSSDRVITEINNAKAEVKREILGGDGLSEAFDTLKEVSEYLESNKGTGAALAESVTKRVRFDEAQSLEEEQLKQVWGNIGLGTPVDLAEQFKSLYQE